MDNLILVPLSERREFLSECVDLLNDQWPRSKAARLRSLEQSFGPDEFPVSLLLIEDVTGDGRKWRLLGHSKILPVPYDKEKCFVESVVVSKELRGKGYGRAIMEMTEAYAKRKGVKTVHLTTHDQQGFYEKLGYEHCDPIVVFGGCSANIQKLLLRSMAMGDSGLDLKSSVAEAEPTTHDKCTENKSVQNVPNSNDSCALLSDAMKTVPLSLNGNCACLPAAVPLPPPMKNENDNDNSKVQILYRPDGSPQSALALKMHMRKVLT